AHRAAPQEPAEPAVCWGRARECTFVATAPRDHRLAFEAAVGGDERRHAEAHERTTRLMIVAVHEAEIERALRCRLAHRTDIRRRVEAAVRAEVTTRCQRDKNETLHRVPPAAAGGENRSIPMRTPSATPRKWPSPRRVSFARVYTTPSSAQIPEPCG